MIKKTKMVCTIGPKSEKREVMQSLLDAGMNVMRLNFSHGDFVEHGGRIDNLEEIMKERGKVFAALLRMFSWLPDKNSQLPQTLHLSATAIKFP